MSRLHELEAMHEADPDDPFILFALGKEYEQLNSTMQALLTFEHLVNTHPAYIATYYHYAKLLYALGNRNEAKNLIQKGIEAGLEEKDLHAVGEMRGLLEMWEEEV